nr:formyltransferase family protein [Rhodothermus marinus]
MSQPATRPPLRLAVFASGGGTNFQAILDAIEAGRLPARVVLCVSDRPTAGALERTRRHGIPTAVLAPKDYPSPEASARHCSRCSAPMTSSWWPWPAT